MTDPDDDPMANASTANQSRDGMTTTVSGQYQDRIDHRRPFVGNRYARGLRLYHTEFMTELNWDFMEFSHADGSPLITRTGLIDTASNSTTNAWIQLSGAGSLRLSYIPALIRFNSDLIGPAAGVKFTKAAVCCATTQASLPVANVTWGTRYTGILLATNDVVFFKVGAATSSAKAIHVTLWSSFSGVDFDLKARCNALPTSTTYDYSAVASGRWEYLRIPYTATCPSGPWYVAVYSHSGDGGFNFVASLAKTAMEKTLNVGIEKNATPEELDTIEATLKGGSRWYYGMTEGQHFVTTFNLYNNRGQGCSSCGGQSCHICFEDDDANIPRVVNKCQSGSKMYIPISSWDELSTMGHELGHYLGCFPDEYCLDKDVVGDCQPYEGCSWCGHSWMGFHPNNLCMSTNHNLDSTDPCTTPSPNAYSNWQTIPNIEFIPTTTPDNFNYENHHFSAAITVPRL